MGQLLIRRVRHELLLLLLKGYPRWYPLNPLLSTHNSFSAIARFLYLTDNNPNQKPYTFFSQITNHLLMQLCDC